MYLVSHDGDDAIAARCEYDPTEYYSSNGEYTNEGCFESGFIKAGNGDDAVRLTDGTRNTFIYGGAGADSIKGGWGKYHNVFGGEGDDEIEFAGWNNILYGENGNDLITSSGTNVNMHGGYGNDTLRAPFANYAYIYGGDGHDTIEGGKLFLTSTIEGGNGDDTITVDVLDGGSKIYGQKGNDKVTVDTMMKQAHVYGGPGNDQLSVSAGDYGVVYGDDDDDIVTLGADTFSMQVILSEESGGIVEGRGKDVAVILGGLSNSIFVDEEDEVDARSGRQHYVVIQKESS